MPALGADMEAGTLVEWHVKPGDSVKRGDVVALVETDKGLVEVEIWESGIMDALVVQPGSKVPVGTVLAKTRTEAAVAPAPIVAAPIIPAPPALASTVPASTAAETHAVRASPAAKQLARERGIDLATLRGTGPHDSITRADVERAAGLGGPPPPAVAAQPLPPPAQLAATDASAMRRAIASAMSRSKREIPHYYVAIDIDVTRAIDWLETENAKRPVDERALFAAVLLKATALAAKQVPETNGFYTEGAFHPSSEVHVGVAISLRQGGLVAPAIHDVGTKSVAEIQAALRDLVSRARAGRLRSSEMSDPTITVTNLGDQGVTSVLGVIYPPQVALVGFGKVVERPWAENGLLGVRRVVTATLAADHRASDGHRGAVFLNTLARILSEPEKL